MREFDLVNVDMRWQGSHGIGRFSIEVGRRLHEVVRIGGRIKPTSPFDVIYQSFRVGSSGRALWFSPGYNAPVFGLSRYIFVIHDLNHIYFPLNSSWLKRNYYGLVMRPACRRAARVLTVSEYSRTRIIEWARVDPEQVVNVGNGVGEEFRPDVPRHNPGYPYLLCMGNRKAHKNEVRLLRAFSKASIDPEIRLLFVGESGGGLVELARELGMTHRIAFAGRVEDALLPGIYGGAMALLFPSLYEGFGLPVVEAMACGTPVLTSNTTSLPEVAGDAALLVDPSDEQVITEGINRIVGDQDLRLRLSELGLERAKLFSWDAVAGRVQAVLDEVTASLERQR